MATFYISRKKQFPLIIDGCGGYDTESRERRVKVAKLIKDILPAESLEPTNINSYDLALLLEKLSDDEHDEVFETYLNTF